MKKQITLIIRLAFLIFFSCLKTESPVTFDTSDTSNTTNPSAPSDTQQIALTILPASAIGDWSNAGVEGGIPQYPVGVNVLDYGAVGDGTTDNTQAILDVIAASRMIRVDTEFMSRKLDLCCKDNSIDLLFIQPMANS